MLKSAKSCLNLELLLTALWEISEKLSELGVAADSIVLKHGK
ncbi:hypothetical protein [Bacillus sp. ISL-45]|nr:hypothetical protein [Bacillus sp. ISL-45]